MTLLVFRGLFAEQSRGRSGALVAVASYDREQDTRAGDATLRPY